MTNHFLHYIKVRSLFIGLYFSVLLTSGCSDGALDLGDSFVSTPTYTALIDSVSISLSTIRADSVATSGTETGLVGYYQHPSLGGQEAVSYFSISPSEDFTWDTKKDVFDSITFVVHPSGYSIGDTTSTFHLQVHQLSEEIEKHDDGKLYNVSHFGYDENKVLGKKSFNPFPKRKKKLEVKLDDALAQSIIDFMVTNHDHSDKTTLFREAYKGFALTCDTNLTRSVLGLSATDELASIRLYSHQVGIEMEEKERNFLLESSTKQFTQIINHNPNTIYNSLENGKDKLNESATNASSLLQSGSGYMVRVDFPYLNNLLEIKSEGRIVKAELIIRPLIGTFKHYELPPTLYLAEVNKVNNIERYFTDADGNPIAAMLVVDKMYNETTCYKYDVTSYLNYRITEPIIDSQTGLMIVLPDDLNNKSLDHVTFGGHTNVQSQSELHIYYYYYDTE
ncbi:MAG: DUF4270 family protein [Marinilabiliaceae bacterium]|nr:DUF4270 family protein [Marinilabiliaceae bacterium]